MTALDDASNAFRVVVDAGSVVDNDCHDVSKCMEEEESMMLLLLSSRQDEKIIGSSTHTCRSTRFIKFQFLFRNAQRRPRYYDVPLSHVFRVVLSVGSGGQTKGLSSLCFILLLDLY
jgi:hypothetical protein